MRFIRGEMYAMLKAYLSLVKNIRLNTRRFYEPYVHHWRKESVFFIAGQWRLRTEWVIAVSYADLFEQKLKPSNYSKIKSKVWTPVI